MYPGAVVVSVELDPGDIACSITEDTSCTALITRDDVYTVSLTLRNDVGSTQAAMNSFNCELKLGKAKGLGKHQDTQGKS